MALQDTDFFLVNRNQESYKMAATALADYVGSGGASVHVGENPPTGDSAQGDLWWKSDVGILYVYYIDENSEQWVQAAGGGGGSSEDGASVHVGDSAPDGTPTQGDLWWNTDDGRLYVYYTDDDSSQWVDASPSGEGGSGGSTGGSSVTVGDSPPSGSEMGDLWWNSDNGRLYVYYTDNDSTQWVEASPPGPGAGEGGGSSEAGASVIVSDTPPGGADEGDLWWNTLDGNLYVWYEDGDTNQWVIANNKNGGDGAGGDTINNGGAAAWAKTDADGNILGALNLTCSKTGTGTYEYTFITPMPSADYSVTASASGQSAARIDNYTADGFRAKTLNNQGSAAEDHLHSVAVHAVNALPPQSGVGADAWAEVARSTTNGANTLNATFNIASVTRIDQGKYTVLFTEPMPNTNYAITGTVLSQNENATNLGLKYLNKTTQGFEVIIGYIQITSNIPTSLYADQGFSIVVHASSTITPPHTWTRNGTTLEPANTGDDVQVTTLNSGQLAGFRNRFINGDMRVVQRGAAGETSVARAFTCDRWYVHNDNAQTYTWDQVDAPGAQQAAGFQKALRIRNASDVYQIRQLIELSDEGARDEYIEGSTWTVSIYSNAAVSYQVQWRSDSTGEGVGSTITVQPETEMVETPAGSGRYVGTFTFPTGSAAPDSTTVALGVSFLRTDGTAGAIQVTGAQFEPGLVATPFEHRPIGTELPLCQRYYQRINLEGAVYNGASNNTTTAWIHSSLATPMRINGPGFEIASGGLDLHVTTGRGLVSGDAPLTTEIQQVSNCETSDASVRVNRHASGDNFVGMTVCYNNDRNQARINLDAEL